MFSSHIIDFLTLGNNFGTAEMRGVWSEQNRLRKHIAVEIALAEVEGELGVIPKWAADDISNKIDIGKIDLKTIAKEIFRLKHSFVPTINALQKQAGDAGQYIHYGPTTQDIVDTGTVLQLKEAFDIVERDSRLIASILKAKAKEYQHTPMVGRTHGVHALPVTFGFKVAVWLDEFIRHLERLREIKGRVLTGNISGAVCTNALLGEIGIEVERKTLDKLGLNTPNIGWQSARDRFSEYASLIALISGTLGKIGNELYNLMRTEIGEIEESFSKGAIGSSTMPHKRNPAAIEGLASLSAPIFKSVSLIHESMRVEHERDAMSWRAEWVALPEINIYISAQLKLSIDILSNIKVNQERMLKNLNMQKGLLLSEKIMLELGKYIGKQNAHKIVYEYSMKAYEEDRAFEEILSNAPELKEYLKSGELEGWLNPVNYLGNAPQKVDFVIERLDKSGLLDE